MAKTKLRLSNDNRSVAKGIIHFPLQKVLTFCSIFPDLLPPQNIREALDAASKMPPISAEWEIEQFGGQLLGRGGMQVRLIKGAE
jgi:hypothetical protein